jgi:uncharacterized membrane protein
MLGFLILVNVLPVLAPIFMNMGWTGPAKVIYFIYSFTCHQIHWRSLHLGEHQCAWCARDMAIWGAVLITFTIIKVARVQGIKWYQIIPFMIPIALDGGIQTIASLFTAGSNTPLYVSTNLMRMLTGGWFGIGIGLVLGNLVISLEETQLRKHITVLGRKIPALLFTILATSITVILSYVAIVGIWQVTSTNYKPSNWLDSEIKLPDTGKFVIQRRQNAVCPVELSTGNVSNQDQLQIDCFFGKQ